MLASAGTSKNSASMASACTSKDSPVNPAEEKHQGREWDLATLYLTIWTIFTNVSIHKFKFRTLRLDVSNSGIESYQMKSTSRAFLPMAKPLARESASAKQNLAKTYDSINEGQLSQSMCWSVISHHRMCDAQSFGWKGGRARARTHTHTTNHSLSLTFSLSHKSSRSVSHEVKSKSAERRDSTASNTDSKGHMHLDVLWHHGIQAEQMSADIQC